MRAHIEQGLRKGERLLHFVETREKEPAPQATGRVWHGLTQYRWIYVVDPVLNNLHSTMLGGVRTYAGLMSARIGEHDWAKDDMFTVPKSFAKAASAAAAACPPQFQFPVEETAVNVLDIQARLDTGSVQGRIAIAAALVKSVDAEFACASCGQFLGYRTPSNAAPSRDTCPGCLRTIV
ncbi:hypothetical protein [Streptomyces europaeiscabiei]|uniref:hypothetical protein n=1 Tax=Streptomyces europaeiscabiei TaxID=146819 RepID=UPI0029B00493|nr:hypothetical protein [Streptomyces europaeiscabiei]MDX3841268.1 hypothetical protein [Streptomyces europaeiscabiei]